MPTRILREGILTSEPINKLSESAELFYRRLMSVADDYGRYFSHPALLRAACYPLQLSTVKELSVKQSLSECVSAGVIVPYGDGKYIQVLKFGQQTRSKSKFPEPSENELLINCKAEDKQMPSLVGVGVVSEGVGGVVGDVGQTEAETIYGYYPRKVGKEDAIKAIIKAQKKRSPTFLLGRVKAYAEATAKWIDSDKQYIPYPATWFNQGRYDDDPKEWERKSVNAPKTQGGLRINPMTNRPYDMQD